MKLRSNQRLVKRPGIMDYKPEIVTVVSDPAPNDYMVKLQPEHGPAFFMHIEKVKAVYQPEKQGIQLAMFKTKTIVDSWKEKYLR
jgi:hypothetical protein